MSFGMRLDKVRGGGENYGNGSAFALSAAYATKMYAGDPVKLVGGYLNLAAPGDAIVGAFKGCEYESGRNAEYRRDWPADSAATPFADRTQILAYATDWNDGLFLMKMADAQGALAQSMVGTVRNHVAAAGDDATGVSRVELGAVAASGTFMVDSLVDPEGTVGGVVRVRVARPQSEPSAA